MLLAWIAFPLALAALCAGLGLLVDALAGKRLPGALIVPAGFAAAIVIAQAMALLDATAPYAASVAIVAAGVGLVAALPWRFGRPDPWPVGAALGAFALFAAPVLLSGSPTFAAYGSLADIPTWLAIAERAMEHGRDLSGLPPSTYAANLDATLGAGDPIGAILPLAAVQRLLGGELAWHLQPYLAFLAALMTLSAWQLIRAAGIFPSGVGERLGASGEPAPAPRALIAFLAAIPAILFGYAGWGGVGEPVAVALLVLATALALGRERTALAIVGIALLCVLAPWPPSFPLQGELWLGTLALAALIAAVLYLGLRVARELPRFALALFAAAVFVPVAIASAGVSLAPYEDLVELREVNQRFVGEGPALVFEGLPYGSHYFLRDVPPDWAEEPVTAELSLSAAGEDERIAEPDDVDYRSLLAYRVLITSRSPGQSRPPSPYRLAGLGEGYAVWRLPSTATFRLLFHMPVGEPGSAIGLPDCSQTVGLGLLALANQLGAAPQDIVVIAAPPPRNGRPQATVAVSVDRTRELCGRSWDWIEAIAPSSSGG